MRHVAEAAEPVPPPPPGTLFLFGKVMSEGKHVSACAVVRDMVRTLVVVPRQGVLTDPSGHIDELLQQSKADASKKARLPPPPAPPHPFLSSYILFPFLLYHSLSSISATVSTQFGVEVSISTLFLFSL